MDPKDRGAVMAPKRRAVEPSFTHPIRQIFLMLVVMGLTGLGGFVLLPRILPVFLANLYLNGFILVVFIIGMLACFWQSFQVFSSVSWIEGFVEKRPQHDPDRAPRLLGSLAALLRSNSGSHLQVGSGSSRSILDSIATRIDEARDITRYIVNLLIFLGLLGTFYGLATTVPAVVETIKSLAPSDGEAGASVFSRLMGGLEAQLGGMGTAFSSSLLGLAGSLIVGLMELFAGHGQNRFYRELEEWLSTITRISIVSADGSEEANMYLSVLAEQVEAMQNLFMQTDIQRSMLDERLGELVTNIDTLTQRIEKDNGERTLLTQLVQGQQAMHQSLEASLTRLGEASDVESHTRLRSIDVQLLRVLEEMQAGRQQSLSDLRTDIATLTQVIRVAAGQQEQG